MDFAKKKQAYENLKGAKHLVHDRQLLAKKLPNSPLANKRTIDATRLQQEILWQLLNVATLEEIVANRPVEKKIIPIDYKEIAERCGTLTAKLQRAKTPDEANCRMDDIKFLSSKLPELAKTKVIEFAKSVYPTFDTLLPELNKTEKQLLELDLETAKYHEKTPIFFALDLEKTAKDRSNATVTQMLRDYKANLPKIGKASNETQTPVPAAPNAENELKEENQELKEVNEELESEKEQLKDENEELQEKLEEVEHEKKN